MSDWTRKPTWIPCPLAFSLDLTFFTFVFLGLFDLFDPFVVHIGPHQYPRTIEEKDPVANGHSEGNDVTDQPARNFKGGFVIVTQPSATAQDSLGQTNHPTSLFIVHLRFRERLCSVAQ